MPNIHLTDPMQEYVQGQIASGAYANLSEVVRAGIRLLMEKETERQSGALRAERRRRAAAGLRAMMENGSAVSDAELKELREHGRR
ncbi:MAG: type II toxin-antitoxin system ParD family antitoxin [Desulfobulbus sp.]|nr:type II toxin-antitoxin system ParD family antitoxin [Desulfobulbus sp.]